MINVSRSAQKYLKNIILKKKMDAFRISVILPGTKYAECKIDYDQFTNFKDTDYKISCSGFDIYIDKIFIPYLKNAKIELLNDDNLNQQLMLMAPYAKSKIFNDTGNNTKINYSENLFEQLEYFINHEINPVLSMHNGKVLLINVTESGYVIIKFLGGCNGCTMSQETLKQHIEKKILHQFPILKGVQDATTHDRGSHSFF